MLEAFFFFFRLHSAKYRKENEGKPKVIIPKINKCCLHILKAMFISIVWQKCLKEMGLAV